MNWSALKQRYATFEKHKFYVQKPYFLLVFVLVFSCCLKAQQKYLFDHLSARNGLASDLVMSVQQDQKGFIWIATSNGLQRYDGQRFITFRHLSPNSPSFPEGTIHALQIDKKGRLWMLFSGFKAGYLNTGDLSFHEVPVDVPKETLMRSRGGMYIDHHDNVMLVVIGNGVLTYDENEKMFNRKRATFHLPPKWNPQYVWQDKNTHVYWIGCDSGLVKFNPKSKLLSYRDHNTDGDDVINAFSHLTGVVFAYFEQGKRFWISAWPPQGMVIKCFYRSNGRTIDWNQTLITSLQQRYHDVRVITELKDGTVWMAGQNLFARIDSSGTGLEHIFSDLPGEFSIRFDNIFQLFQDREGNIWISSDKGLYRFNPTLQFFKAHENKRYDKDSVYTPDVTDFLQTQNGEIFVATWGNGIFSYDKDFKPIKSMPVIQSVRMSEGLTWCLHQRSNGDIWRGNQGGILYIYHASTNKTERLEPAVFEGSTIRQVTEDKDGNLWFGTQRGFVVKWDAVENKFTLMHKLRSVIPRLITDSAGFIWVATEIGGVYKLNNKDGNILNHYTSQGPVGKKLRTEYASDIAQYNDSLIIISGHGLNILNTKNNQVEFVTTDDGLPTNDVANLMVDRLGWIWMTSGVGVVGYDKIGNKVHHYDSRDGVHTNSYNVASASMLDDGRIAFGTAHDMMVFDPARIASTYDERPGVEITGFFVMNKALPIDSLLKSERINLSHDENSLVIEFSTLTFQNIYPISYMMEGLDKNWAAAGELNRATYSYLPPGTYTFKAASRDLNGKYTRFASLKIKVETPFWKAWWFYSMLALCVGGILFWLDRERMQRLRKEQQMRASIAGNLHDQVNTALKNINVLSEIAGMKADTQPEQSKEFIYEIQQKSRNMVIAMNDMLWSIDPANDNMIKTVERVEEVAHAMSNRFGVEVDLKTDNYVSGLHLDMKTRHEFIVIYKLAMLTLIQELRSPETTVRLDYNKSFLQLKIFSKGVTIPKTNCTASRQIAEMKKHAKIIQASLDTESDEKGTSIILGMKV
jgi:ligand-binding sensor domain-containing protein